MSMCDFLIKGKSSMNLLFAGLFIAGSAFAEPKPEQDDSLKVLNWVHYDLQDDGIAGASVNKAYQLLDGF